MDYASMDTLELSGLLVADLHWLCGAIGRFGRLLEVRAPLPILMNELDVWGRKMAEVQGILDDGRVQLTDSGDDAWRSVMVEYETLPDADDVAIELGPAYRKAMEDLGRMIGGEDA